MALSTVTITVSQLDATQSTVIVRGTLAISASPGTYPTAGWTLDFSGIDQVKSNSLPLSVTVFSKAAPTGLYVYHYAFGTTLANGTLQVFTGAAAQSPLAEFAAGSTPAGVSGDTIGFEAIFPKLI